MLREWMRETSGISISKNETKFKQNATSRLQRTKQDCNSKFSSRARSSNKLNIKMKLMKLTVEAEKKENWLNERVLREGRSSYKEHNGTHTFDSKMPRWSEGEIAKGYWCQCREAFQLKCLDSVKSSCIRKVRNIRWFA